MAIIQNHGSYASSHCQLFDASDLLLNTPGTKIDMGMCSLGILADLVKPGGFKETQVKLDESQNWAFLTSSVSLMR